MHRNHVIPCALMFVAALALVAIWGVQLGTLALAGVMLLCPLLMLLMVRAMVAGGHRHEVSGDSRSETGVDTPR